MTNTKQPPGFVLLSAGRGTRMSPLTDGIPKSLLQVGTKLVLDWLLEAILMRTSGEVVVVTGYGAETVEAHIAQRYGDRVACARNQRYAEDVNILSVEVGVEALAHPDRGYVIVETDQLLDTVAWDQLFDAINETPHSYWICKGYYHKDRTGGIVHVDDTGTIDCIEYQPKYDAHFDGWGKMAGMLIVAADQVVADRKWRQRGIRDSLKQYYLVPWQRGVKELPSKMLQIEGLTADFNTIADFQEASRRFLAAQQQAAQLLASQQARVTRIPVEELRHIEGFSEERVTWLLDKVTREGRWSKPLAVAEHGLVLDGQHRMEVAKRLQLAWVPAIVYDYSAVEVWSLRPEISLNWEIVVERALADNPYPYKTVKHKFPDGGVPAIDYDLEELRS